MHDGHFILRVNAQRVILVTNRMCFLPQCQTCGGIYRLFLIAILFILAWHALLRMEHNTEDKVLSNDAMNQKLFGLPVLENCCSGWKVSHFTFFFIIGLLYPHCDVVAIGGGILWEGVEVAVSAYMKQERQPLRSNDKVEYSQNWWAGSFADIAFNIAGFYLGKLVALKTPIGKKCQGQTAST